MRILAALLSMSVAVLLAQSSTGTRKRSRGRADAGDAGDAPLYLGPDRPGSLKPDPPAGRDGGTARVPDAAPDGGSQAQQILELRARIAVLEQQAAMAQQQAAQSQAVNDQLQALREQLGAADAQRQQERQQQQARQQAVQNAIGALGNAQNQLSTGDTSIGDALDQAQSSFSGQAQRDIQAAREALRNGDLTAARYSLQQAISDAQQGH